MMRGLEERLCRWLSARSMRRALADPEGKYVCPKCRGWAMAGTTSEAITYHLRFGCEPMDPVAANREAARILRKYEQVQGR